jgi:hypothetical protein
MLRLKLLISTLLLAASILACSGAAAPQVENPAGTVVAQTLQALASATAPATAVASTALPTPSAAADPLPHSIYFLNNDKGGLLQIFRLARDGKSLQQITFEPASVESYDVSPKDGGLAYATNNQLYWTDAAGAGRRLLVDGGPVDDNTRFTNSLGVPVWSPDGATIAFNHGGLNFYKLTDGTVNQVLQNQIDNSAGFPVVRELYAPVKYSSDGSKLLISIGFNEGGAYGIYHPSDNTVLRLSRSDGGMVCCDLDWVPDGSGLYASSPVIGVIDSGLWYVDASSGNVTTLLPGGAPDGTYNFADAPQVGRDGKLYFFFNNLPQILPTNHPPLYLVRSGTDGVTGREQLQPTVFKGINEVLWAPDASLAVVAFAPTEDVNIGGEAEIVYPDGRPNVALVPYAQTLRWGL